MTEHARVGTDAPGAGNGVVDLRTEVTGALARGEIGPYFQPIVDAATGRLSGAEALVRWDHPTLGLLGPAMFLPLVEELGLMAELSRRMIEGSLQVRRRWARSGVSVPVSVNVTPESMLDPTFPDLVRDLLILAGEDAGDLIIEVTEQAALLSADTGVSSALSALGVRLAIDDFGAGFSSLQRLGDLRVHELKLDMSLVQPLTHNLNYRKIVELTIELAHQLGAQVVAEGVDSEALHSILASMECDLLQGYLFAQPLDGDAFLDWAVGRQMLRARHRPLTFVDEPSGDRSCEADPAPQPVTGAPATRPRRNRLPAGLIPMDLIVAAGMLVAYGWWRLTGWGGSSDHTLIGDLWFVPVNGAAIAAAIMAARRKELGAKTCRAWRLIAVALCFYLLGDLLQTYLEVVLRQAPDPSVADAAYLAFYPLVLAGLLTFPTSRRRPHERLTIALDVATVTVGATIFLWYLLVSPSFDVPKVLTAGNVVSLAYPIGDLVLLCGAAVVLLRGVASASVVPLRLFSVGLMVFVAADVLYRYAIIHGGYQGGQPVDMLWIAALCIVYLAAMSQTRVGVAPAVTDGRDFPADPISPLPYVAVGVSYLLIIAVGFRRLEFEPLGGLLVGALVLTALVTVRQVTALKDNAKLLRRYHSLAGVDPLTGFYNRYRFIDLAEFEFGTAHFSGESLSALVMDVDRLQWFNDRHGHAGGDHVLADLAMLCRRAVPPSAIMARFGDDEFAVLLRGEDQRGAQALAERLHLLLDESPIGVSVSIGIAEAAGCEDVDALLARAHRALLLAKQSGGAQWAACPEPQAALPMQIPAGPVPSDCPVPSDDGLSLRMAR